MQRDKNVFTKRFVALLLAQRGDISRKAIGLKSTDDFNSVGKVLGSDEYIDHVKSGRFLCGKKRK